MKQKFGSALTASLRFITSAFHRTFDVIEETIGAQANWLYRLFYVAALSVAAVLITISLSRETVLELEAEADAVGVVVSAGRPLEWAIPTAKFKECTRKEMANAQPPLTIAEEVLVLRAGTKIRLVDTGETTRITFDSVDRKVACEESDVAAIGSADGFSQRLIALPAELLIDRRTIQDDLNLLFRGGLTVGDDVAATQQAILKRGTVTLLESAPRSSNLVTGIFKVTSEFTSKEKKLSPGDRVVFNPGTATSADAGGADAKGFIRIEVYRQYEPIKSPLVIAVSSARSVQIVRPFSTGKSVEASIFTRLLNDPIIQTGLGVFVLTLLALAQMLYALSKSEKKRKE